MAKSATRPALFTVYYDGGCKLCRTRIAIYKMEARRGEIAIDWRDVSEDPEALAEFDIGPEDARRRLHVVDADGTLLAGADAFAHAVYDSGLAHAFHRLRKSFRGRPRGTEPATEGRAR